MNARSRKTWCFGDRLQQQQGTTVIANGTRLRHSLGPARIRLPKFNQSMVLIRVLTVPTTSAIWKFLCNFNQNTTCMLACALKDCFDAFRRFVGKECDAELWAGCPLASVEHAREWSRAADPSTVNFCNTAPVIKP